MRCAQPCRMYATSLIILMTHHNTKTGDLYPSQQTIAGYLGLCITQHFLD